MKRIFTGAVMVLFLFCYCGKKTNETTAQQMDITETVFASGTLEPEGKYNLTAQTEGYIIEMKFDNGDTVKNGETLAIIDNRTNYIGALSAERLLGIAGQNASPEGPTLKQALNNLLLLREKVDQDSLQYQRYLQLSISNSISKLELENSRINFVASKTNYLNANQNYRLLQQQTEQQLIMQKSQRDINNVASQNNEIKAVVGGKIYRKLKEVGDYVRRGDVIFTLGHARDVYARLSVDESNISKIKLGQEAIVQLNTNKKTNYRAVVSEIYPSFDEPTQSFYIKTKFTEAPDFKIAGTQLQANIIIGRKKNALVIPKIFLNYGNKVLVKGKGEVKVETGFISGEWVEIIDGIDQQSVLISEQIK
jgi:HlyD family secretion protein